MKGKGKGEVPPRLEERRPLLEVLLSNLLKLSQHLFYGPDKPQLLVPLSSRLGDVTEHSRGVDGVEVFKEVEV